MSAVDTVRAFAPATVSNLGLGFDVLGLAVAERGDTVTGRSSREPGVRITAIRGDGGALPLEAERNAAGIAAIATLRAAGVETGIELEIDKGLPIGSGLGSSAASAAAAACVVNVLIGSPLRKSDLIETCLEAEAALSGRHADNLAPCLLGGLVLVRSLDPIDVVRLPVPEELVLAVVSPHHELLTRAAREALPTHVPLEEMIRQSAAIASFVSACYADDLSLLARCLADDDPVTRARIGLIPGGSDVMRAALEVGALGSSISGAGPSIYAMCRSRETAEEAATVMQEVFHEHGCPSDRLITGADRPGARLL